MKVLVTGSAGFIGFHVSKRLLADGHEVVGVDSFSSYYDPLLKEARNSVLQSSGQSFQVHRIAIEDKVALDEVWDEARPEVVIHLAAQAGVRYSIESPETYVSSNLIGTFNVLEAARRTPPAHLLVASTSSAYGANTDMPFQETDRAVHPLTLYAATKGATELMGHSYSHLFGIPTTFFRFFTVYGPWGRPDMALFKFTQAILKAEPIEVYGGGHMTRDFTYIDDLVESIIRLIPLAPKVENIVGDSISPTAPYRLVNIGGGMPVGLMDYIAALEAALGMQAKKNFLPMQDGDVPATYASSDLLEALIGYKPSTPVGVGVPAFVSWYREHYSS